MELHLVWLAVRVAQRVAHPLWRMSFRPTDDADLVPGSHFFHESVSPEEYLGLQGPQMLGLLCKGSITVSPNLKECTG